MKHSKEAVEKLRNDNLKELNEKFGNREADLIRTLDSLQVKYCESNEFANFLIG
jgi:hypothetical protein